LANTRITGPFIDPIDLEELVAVSKQTWRNGDSFKISAILLDGQAARFIFPACS
jgi:hypothetical protein